MIESLITLWFLMGAWILLGLMLGAAARGNAPKGGQMGTWGKPRRLRASRIIPRQAARSSEYTGRSESLPWRATNKHGGRIPCWLMLGNSERYPLRGCEL